MKKIFLFLIICLIFLQNIIGVFAQDDLLDNDYVTYIIDETCINEKGQILIDTHQLTESFKNKQNKTWKVGDESEEKVKFINQLPYSIRLSDYQINIPSYQSLSTIQAAPTIRTSFLKKGTTDVHAVGKDGNMIPIKYNVLRCPNQAIASLYDKSIEEITLSDIINLENKIKEIYPDLSSYSQYLCQYYQVSSLDHLTIQQKKEILNENPIKKVGHNDILFNEKTLTYTCYVKDSYYVYEFDKDVIELGYHFYLDSSMMFSFDKDVFDLCLQSDERYHMIHYLDKDSYVRQQMDQMVKGHVMYPGDELVFENLQYYMDDALEGQIYIYQEMPPLFQIDFIFEPIIIQGYAFYDDNKDGIMQEEEKRISHLKMNLWQESNLVEITYTDEEGYYSFENQIYGQIYQIKTECLSHFIPTKNIKNHMYGNGFINLHNNTASSKPFVFLDNLIQYHIGFAQMKYHLNYHSNGGTFLSQNEKTSYQVDEEVKILESDFVERKDYHFIGWNTKKDGTGTFYLPHQILLMPSHHIELYAMWEKDKIVHHIQKTNSMIDVVQTSDESRFVYILLLCLINVAGFCVYKSLKKNR